MAAAVRGAHLLRRRGYLVIYFSADWAVKKKIKGGGSCGVCVRGRPVEREAVRARVWLSERRMW